MNMMRNKNRNNGGNRQRGGRRYNNNGGGGNNRPNEGQNPQRQKHHATQMREKYNNLLRDAQNNGDRVDVEYYLQHIDHYSRVLADIAVIEAERYAQYREATGQTSEDEGTEGSEGEANAEGDTGEARPPREGRDRRDRGDRGDRNEHGDRGDHRRGNRFQRPPRRNLAPEGAAEGQALAEAPSQAAPTESNGEIPLPGSILPPI